MSKELKRPIREKHIRIPSFGYELTLWGGELSYRATAVAYMERENIKQVTHKNGKNYFLNELRDAMLTH